MRPRYCLRTLQTTARYRNKSVDELPGTYSTTAGCIDRKKCTLKAGCAASVGLRMAMWARWRGDLCLHSRNRFTKNVVTKGTLPLTPWEDSIALSNYHLTWDSALLVELKAEAAAVIWKISHTIACVWKSSGALSSKSQQRMKPKDRSLSVTMLITSVTPSTTRAVAAERERFLDCNLQGCELHAAKPR